MSELPRRLCHCGNPARDDRPTCGIVLCLTNDAYERALIAAGRSAKPKPQLGVKHDRA